MHLPLQSRLKAFCGSVADELAEQRPNMTIKVTAFTVSEKSVNTQRR